MNHFKTIEWFEELPANCPPDNAYSPNNATFYRLAEQYPPTERDFFSHRKLYPSKPFKTTECIARSLSIFSELLECANILKLPTQKGKKIIQLKLSNESGVILQTGGKMAHYSWWRSKRYNPIPNSEEVDLN